LAVTVAVAGSQSALQPAPPLVKWPWFLQNCNSAEPNRKAISVLPFSSAHLEAAQQQVNATPKRKRGSIGAQRPNERQNRAANP
jgi:hypothetical protein